MKTANVLAISGGGLRGILAASIIRKIENQIPFIKNVDLFAGTSTGSIIAAGLASGKFTPEEIVDLYKVGGPKIFKRSIGDRLMSVFGLYKSKYSSKGLADFMRYVFGDLKIADVPKPILIPAMDLGDAKRGYKAKFFNNFKDSENLNLKLSDVVIASCSGPTYFPAHTIDFGGGDKRQFVDGGVIVNHPAVSSIASAIDPKGLAVPLEGVRCLAITTGYYPMSAMGWRERGIVGWVDDIFDLLTEQLSTVDFQAAKLLTDSKGSRYKLINPTLTKPLKFDSLESLKLDELASIYSIDEDLKWIRKNFKTNQHDSRFG